ncbi:MAG: hypothetical protein COV55_00900 [Candidatus Komeilibacteria bacterium CG11_big_fil_rev_8_21_14_0_20_36_20]|uniref:Carbamoyltransferase domain-containing protein n=1 Tax=Candidatus Komeilibacteria bacterium CG11_big_fil_rev_8_21_14_0_20_36_20 TaxID=1974477 RepID=A0A2H0NDK8_9BACT|nr:MAG: hypothetical protein COV55_00900 [Candidatus Komeilibacteria bacterium CG11_big_fil_rev_8_21_14_0_20_36_20]PIR81338.1 MAG: hypothetical protein COU21_03870 [Candidatus Komeilibacteria bacterium CG10_big_fil_rev_8_21_14_0_10_36_65]PJC54968.1 MAG: hypothetical protein CO027_04540 [Candidatus Komeilibacteria bacterium CG_4_9_14_0_2_um_filter_36_13]
MKILSFKPSIPPYFGTHDGAVILLEDNKIISILEEERFTRVKHAEGQFPINAISITLNMNNLTLSDIDYITIPFEPTQWPFVKQKGLKHSEVILEAKDIIYDQLKLKFGNLKMPPITFYNHHLSHAASAYYLSGFDESLVITVDGAGEKESSVIFKGVEGKLKEIKVFDWPNSIGEIYTDITGFLGFKPISGEGQTMGLSAYGNYDKKIKKLFDKKIMKLRRSGYQIRHKKLASSWKDRFNYIKATFAIDILEEKKEKILIRNMLILLMRSRI